MSEVPLYPVLRLVGLVVGGNECVVVLLVWYE